MPDSIEVKVWGLRARLSLDAYDEHAHYGFMSPKDEFYPAFYVDRDKTAALFLAAVALDEKGQRAFRRVDYVFGTRKHGVFTALEHHRVFGKKE